MVNIAWESIAWCMLLMPLLTEAQQDNLCPIGWVHHDQSCYLLHKERSNWFEAEIVCTGHNSNLAIVTDVAENTFIKGLIQSAFKDEDDAHVWLGASDDVVEGTFLWYGKDTPLTFTDWEPGEPNAVDLDLEEDCLVYWADYGWKWADLDCHDQCFAVCEKSAEGTLEIIG